jgi:hypothetical protein
MLARPLTLLALTAFVSAAAATQAMACCGCAYTCAPPQVQVWGLSPSYVVNQGPVYSGPGFYTSPTYEGEVSTVDYPYVGYSDYPRSYNPYRHRSYHPYWEGNPLEPPHRFGMLHRHDFEMIHRHDAGVLYRHGFGRRAIIMSGGGRWVSHSHREFRERREW